jgi:hypothetical protein
MKKLTMHSWHRLRPITMKISIIFSLVAVIRILNMTSTRVPFSKQDPSCAVEEIDMIQQKTYSNHTTFFTIPKNIKEISPVLFEERPKILPIDNSIISKKTTNEDIISLPDNSFRLPLPEEKEKIEE